MDSVKKEKLVKEVLFIQLNNDIIKKFRSVGIQCDMVGSAYITLMALKSNKLSLLDELDDMSNAKRMMQLYQNLNRLGLIQETTKESYAYYELTPLGLELVKFVEDQFEDVVEEPLVIVPAHSIATLQEPDITIIKDPGVEGWAHEYNELFPRRFRTSPKTLITRFEKFFNEFPEYANRDIILGATKMYIKELTEHDGYIRMSNYFIYKMESDRSIIYDLSDWCHKFLEKKDTHRDELDTSFLNLA